jgi:hypothetical protein
MANERSRQALFEFLDYLGTKGLIPSNTVAARKSAASKILGILEDGEAADVTKLDLDEVMRRFQNLQGQNYTPASLNSYLSRLRSTVEDFKTYLNNPLAFKPNGQTREKRGKYEPKKEGSGVSEAPHTASAQSKPPVMPSVSILPIQIRLDTTVYVQGIPLDLTEAEAAKIANVIRAMATPV